jgi:nitroimidazol reductase NimA-like FMN-containing flavoprotein (pyridoxamine 5'-phosphate oxidase superfamily)
MWYAPCVLHLSQLASAALTKLYATPRDLRVSFIVARHRICVAGMTPFSKLRRWTGRLCGGTATIVSEEQRRQAAFTSAYWTMA